MRRNVAPLSSSPQLAPVVVQSLNSSGVWIDPSLRGLADASAMEQAARRADFPVRVLVVRRVPDGFASVQALAQVVHQQLELQDGLVIIATSDDARLGLFGAGLDAATLNQIVEASAQTWTQEGYAGGVAQTLRLVAYERELQAQARFLRVAVPGAIGALCLLSAFALWLRRKTKYRARRKISQSLPTVVPVATDEIETEHAVETA